MSRDDPGTFKKLGRKEREYVEQYKTLFFKLLNDLYKQDMLRLKFKEDDRRSIKIIETLMRFSEAFNNYDGAYMGDSGEEYIRMSEKFGLSEDNLTHLWWLHLIIIMIGQVELFKTLFLIYLQKTKGIKGDETLTELLTKLRRITPKYVDRLECNINKELRNALVHGNYWLEGDNIHYAKDSTLKNPKTVSLPEFWIEVRRHNILCQTFLHYGSIRMKQLKEFERNSKRI